MCLTIIRLHPEYMPEPTADDPAPTWTELSRETLNKVYVTQPYKQNDEPWNRLLNLSGMKGNDIKKG
jgi:hypothetical protein